MCLAKKFPNAKAHSLKKCKNVSQAEFKIFEGTAKVPDVAGETWGSIIELYLVTRGGTTASLFRKNNQLLFTPMCCVRSGKLGR